MIRPTTAIARNRVHTGLRLTARDQHPDLAAARLTRPTAGHTIPTEGQRSAPLRKGVPPRRSLAEERVHGNCNRSAHHSTEARSPRPWEDLVHTGPDTLAGRFI